MSNRKEIAHKYYIKHKKEILAKKKRYNRLKAKEISNQRKKYYLKNKPKFKQLHKKYITTHAKEIKVYRKEYENSHKKERQNYNKKYYQKNKSIINSRRNIYFIQRKKQDINFKIKCNLRSRISEVLKGNPKITTTMKLMGCSIEQLKQHLQKQFKEGMTWKNYGKWHIDHIKLCCSFDLNKLEEQKTCFHYTNLRPLWAKDNLQRNKK